MNIYCIQKNILLSLGGIFRLTSEHVNLINLSHRFEKFPAIIFANRNF